MQGEFNKLKAHIEMSPNDSFGYVQKFIKSRLGVSPSEEEVKRVMEFVNNPNRTFELKKTMNEVLLEEINAPDEFDPKSMPHCFSEG